MHVWTVIELPVSVSPFYQQGPRKFFSNIYILAKQPILSCCNVVHSTVLLNSVNCLYTICNRFLSHKKKLQNLNSKVISTQ
jgi:hypothetical protein